MMKRISIIVFLLAMLHNPQAICAERSINIEIFDPKQDKVVKTVQLNNEINNMVKGWINGIDGIYGKNNPVKDDGYAIKFPLDPPVQVQNKWLNAVVKEVYLIIPEKDAPFIMVFESEYRLVCFPFTGNIAELSKVLDFKLNRYRPPRK